MYKRCNNPNATYYKNYGGRGIKVDSCWNSYLVFKDWSLKNNWEYGLTIDRIDVNDNYCPENCRWITNEENLKLAAIYNKENQLGVFSKESNAKTKQTNRNRYGIKVKVYNDTESFICDSLGEAAEILSKKLDRKMNSVYSQVKQAIKGKCNGIAKYKIETIETNTNGGPE